MRPIFLVGMMGAGKSTVGRVLAERLGRDFVDLDNSIVAEAGRPIPEIFDTEGESGFRKREQAALGTVIGGSAVVALGGGTLSEPAAAAQVAAAGVAVYLRASPEELASRLSDSRQRPLLAGLDAEQRVARLRSILEERHASYEEAVHTVDVAGRDVDDIASEIAQAVSG
jgi:shikimate kinase